jgi:outer membrane receptor protein involved in Fe transport
LPRYYDSQIRWDAGDPRKRGLLTLWLFTSNDRMSDEHTSFTEAFVRLGARYKRQLGATTYSVTPWAGRDVLSFEDDGDPEVGGEPSELSRTQWPVGVRADITRDAKWGHVAAGLDVQGGRYGRLAFGDTESMGENNGVPMIPRVDRWSSDIGVWVEGRYRVDGDRVVVRPGLRLERYGLSDEVVIDPRLQVTHTLSPKLVLRESVGLYHQPPTAADTDPDFGNPALDSAYTLQTSAGAETVGPLGMQIAATVFFHRGWNQPVAVRPPSGTDFDNPAGPGSGIGAVMMELLEEQLGSFEYRDNVGELASYGVELGVKHQVGRFLGWGSYTLTKARRKDDPMRFSGWRAYQLDQLHNLSLVGSMLVGKWQIGARFRLVTGNPYTPILAQSPDGEVEGAPLSRRLPDFIQVDFRADRAWKRDWGTMKLFIDVQHATWPLRENYEDAGWDWEHDRPEYQKGLPILPMFGLEYVN